MRRAPLRTPAAHVEPGMGVWAWDAPDRPEIVAITWHKGVPVAIDFCNPAPDAEAANVGQANFEWVVEAVSEMAIRKAREHKPGRDNLSWGKFLQAAVRKSSLGELV